MRSWIAAGVLALVLAVGVAVPAHADHRHSRSCGHPYSYSRGYYEPYRYPAYGYGSRHHYGSRHGYRYAPYRYYSPYGYGAPYVLYAPPPPAYGYYYAPYRRYYRPRVSVTFGLW